MCPAINTPARVMVPAAANDKWALRQKINLQWNKLLDRALEPLSNMKEITMRGALLWLIGIPIPIIILLYLFNVF